MFVKNYTFICCDQFNSDWVCTVKNKHFAVEDLNKNSRLLFSSINERHKISFVQNQIKHCPELTFLSNEV